jgi:hypothetical protein
LRPVNRIVRNAVTKEKADEIAAPVPSIRPGKRTGSVDQGIKVKLHQEQEFIIGGYTDRKDRGNILALCWWFL